MRRGQTPPFFSLMAITLCVLIPGAGLALPIQIPLNPVVDERVTFEATQNPVSAQEALTNFNTTGDIRYLSSLSAPPPSATPAEKALFAMSLAVRGNNNEALRRIAALPRERAELLTNLVKAQVAKNRGNWQKANSFLASAQEHGANHPYVYLVKGQIHYAEMEIERAKTSFQQALLFNPNLAVAESNLAAAFLMDGNKERALELYESALSKRPLFCPALHGKALISLEQTQLDTAEQLVLSCLSANPEFSPAHLLLANIAIERNRPANALEHARSLNGVEAQRIRQQSRLMLGDTDELVAGLDKSIQGQNIALDYINSLAYAFIGNPEKADSLLTELVNRTGNSAIFSDLSYSIGLLLNEQTPETGAGSDSGTISALLSALTSSSPAALTASPVWYDGLVLTKLRMPEDILMSETEAGKLGLSLLLMKERATTLAQRKLGEVNKSSNNNVLVQYLMSRQLLALGKREEAENLLNEVLKKEPGFFSANVLAADIAAAKAEFNAALNYMESADQVYKAPGVVLKLGILNERLGNVSATESHYKELIELIPESHIAYNQLAWFYATNNLKLAEALELAEKANDIMPGNVSTMDTLGWLHHLQSDNAEALRWLEKADESAGGSHPGIKYRKAQVLSDLGQREKALATIGELLSSENQATRYRNEAIKLRQELEH